MNSIFQEEECNCCVYLQVFSLVPIYHKDHSSVASELVEQKATVSMKPCQVSEYWEI